MRRCSIVTCPVSSTPRSSRKGLSKDISDAPVVIKMQTIKLLAGEKKNSLCLFRETGLKETPRP